MSWVKLDDQFFSNPKVLLAGRDARDLYLAGLTFCAAQLTDGYIPDNALRMLAAQADVDESASLAARLVAVDLWERVEEGYQIHDWLKYNPPASEQKRKRDLNAERQARFREAHADEIKQERNARRNALRNAGNNGGVTRAPSPYPNKRESNDSLVGADATDAPVKRATHLKPVISEDSEAMRLTQYMLAKCLAYKPDFKKPSDLQRWARDFDLMLRVDGREYEHAKLVVDFAKTDTFWRDVIWSAAKIREKFDQLDAKRRAQSRPLKATGTADAIPHTGNPFGMPDLSVDWDAVRSAHNGNNGKSGGK